MDNMCRLIIAIECDPIILCQKVRNQLRSLKKSVVSVKVLFIVLDLNKASIRLRKYPAG